MTETGSRPIAGIVFILVGTIGFSVNDVLLKFLSRAYPLHEMTFIRALIALFFCLVLVRLEGGWGLLRTRRPGLHLLRVTMVVVSNLTYFAALASLPLGEATAIFFVAPLLITLVGIPLLGEKAGPLRLGAVVAGLLGVVIVVQPWAGGAARDAPWYIYLLPLAGAFTYAINQILTRRLGAVSRASAMAVYIQLAFLVVSLGFWAVAGDGRFARGLEDPSLLFVLRAWAWPEGRDVWLFLALGVNSALIGYCMAQAYRSADAGAVAPFEYVGLPLAVFWGWTIWADLPTPVEMAGIALILGAGLFVFLRERQQGRRLAALRQAPPRY
ncbi:DMT family transporter [Roseovarius spongiae]|uniref:DMT family transporter n=1 Tax=Roseovarius spongiae TaxID=2320272 RepID=A0A3A8AZ73_9RHOB|nr:DMT family transporter [Roseovarius spongiae]RKF17236.1 DMT family transporter [Roseovarius spongiae]